MDRTAALEIAKGDRQEYRRRASELTHLLVYALHHLVLQSCTSNLYPYWYYSNVCPYPLLSVILALGGLCDCGECGDLTSSILSVLKYETSELRPILGAS